MDASHWPQHQVGSLARTMEEIQPPPNNMMNSNNMATISANSRASQMVEKRARPQKEQNLNCPRCNSTNTKFCYYNNYSLTQPRYFCKTCRRYWTQGGSLRNVPVGGGSRKNKRSSSSSSPSILASSSSAAAPSMSNASKPLMPTRLIPDLNPPTTLPHLITAPQNPSKFLEAQDLNLAFPMGHEAINVNGDISNSTPSATTTTTTNSCGGGTGNSTPISALELLRGGIAARGSLNSYFPMPIPDPNSPLYPSGLPNLQEFKPNVGVFSSSHGDDHGNSSNIIGGARLLFPFADMNKLASSDKTGHHHPEVDVQSKGGNDHHQQHHHQQHHHHHHYHQGSTGYWTGMLGGGAW